MKRLLILMILLAFGITNQIPAKNNNDSSLRHQNENAIIKADYYFINKLLGKWHSNGEFFGKPADLEMSWMPELNDRYVQIKYNVLIHGTNGKQQAFKGTAFYRAMGENQFIGTWFDSGGDMHPIQATNDSEKLISLWGTSETKLGKTIYKLLDKDHLEVTDFIQSKDGVWKIFSKNVFTRTLN